jgi:hypothetical protein
MSILGLTRSAARLAEETGVSISKAKTAIQSTESYDAAAATVRSTADDAANNGLWKKLRLGSVAAGSGGVGLIAGDALADEDLPDVPSENGFNAVSVAMSNPAATVIGLIIVLVVIRTATETGVESLLGGA